MSYNLVKIKYTSGDECHNLILALNPDEYRRIQSKQFEFKFQIMSIQTREITETTYYETAPFLNSADYVWNILKFLGETPETTIETQVKLRLISLEGGKYYSQEEKLHLQITEDGDLVCLGGYDPETGETLPLNEEQEAKCQKLRISTLSSS